LIPSTVYFVTVPGTTEVVVNSNDVPTWVPTSYIVSIPASVTEVSTP
jgi:hypothetical protein